MRIAVIGLGYVGSVAGACLAERGHDVTFVEVNPVKIDELNAGLSPVVEAGLPELIRHDRDAGRLRATVDLVDAVISADLTLICVGTPTGPNGDVHLQDLEKVAGQIGVALAARAGWHLVVLTSTVPPGTTQGLVVPLLERESGKVCGVDFGVAFSPEFLREGSAVADFRRPEMTVVGASDRKSLATAAALYRAFGGRVHETTIPVAETVKLAANAWHALKVTFANEVGRFCAAEGVDSRAVMELLQQDTRLNVSAAYLNPGYAFGGSCLPKDLRTLNYRARVRGVELPVLENILRSNRAQVDFALAKLESYGARRVAVLGLAFKHGTDDLRESPILELVERLLGKGYEVAVHDESVSVPRLVGANREHLMRTIPHITCLLRHDVAEALDGAEVVVVGQGNPAYRDILDRLSPGQRLLDLTGVARTTAGHPQYEGLAW
jgi:GDP-mannose 6-dehydrogenase